MEKPDLFTKRCVSVFFQFQKQQCLVPIYMETGKCTQKPPKTIHHALPLDMINMVTNMVVSHNVYFIFLGHLYIQYPVYMSCTVYMGISRASMF